MARWIVRLLAAVSLFLAVAASACWARSQTRIDNIHFTTARTSWFVISYDRLFLGVISLEPGRATSNHGFSGSSILLSGDEIQEPWNYTQFGRITPTYWEVSDRVYAFAGIHFHFPGGSGGTRFYRLQIPFPFLIVGPLVFLVFWIRPVGGRHKTGHCYKCDYDLNAHSPGEACPECGTKIPKTAKTPTTEPLTERWGISKLRTRVTVATLLLGSLFVFYMATPDRLPPESTPPLPTDPLVIRLNKLAQPDDVNWVDQPLEHILALIAAQNGISIQVDWDALRAAGVEKSKRMSISLRGTTLGTNMRLVLNSTDAKAPLSFAAYREVLVISTSEGLAGK